ncbi:hypothetical protein [Trichormus variabilis]|nr:hypothetical protein [Trichormus variabilis]
MLFLILGGLVLVVHQPKIARLREAEEQEARLAIAIQVIKVALVLGC